MWKSGGAAKKACRTAKGFATQSKDDELTVSTQAAKGTRRELETRDAKASGTLPLKNPKHEKLAREYAAGNSQAAAWRTTFGREPSTGNASRTFARPEIHARIDYLRGEFNRLAGLSLAALQARLLRIADANVADILESDGGALRLRDLTKLPAAGKAAISELEISDEGAIKVKTLRTADRLHAVDSLIKTVGGFQAEEPSRGMTLEELILSARKDHSSSAVQLNVVTGVPRSANETVAPVLDQEITASSARRVRL
jgi:hypothetical protein